MGLITVISTDYIILKCIASSVLNPGGGGMVLDGMGWNEADYSRQKQSSSELAWANIQLE